MIRASELREKYSNLRRTGKLCGTIKAAIAKRLSRDENKAQPDKLLRALPQRYTKQTIPLGSETRLIRQAEHSITSQFPRLKNWDRTVPSVGKTRMRTNDLGRYSSRCRYTHYTYTVEIECWGRTTGKALCFHFHGTTQRIPAPRGWVWATDNNGIKIVARNDARCDYHPTCSDLQTLTVKQLCAKARENLTQRKLAAAKLKQQTGCIKRAEREGCMICLADSLRAGNCRAGTIRFASRHHLNPRNHYKPSQLLALVNGDLPRVAIVVAVAMKRHREEMSRGYALLAEHTA